jgi:hypothetical protein
VLAIWVRASSRHATLIRLIIEPQPISTAYRNIPYFSGCQVRTSSMIRRDVLIFNISSASRPHHQ